MPLNINLQQILLHALNFVILFGAMYFLLYKPVKSFMDSRKAHYEKMDEDAKAVLAEAEKTKAGYEAQLKSADEEIARRQREANEALQHAVDERRAQAEQQAGEIVRKAREDAAREHERVMEQAKGEISGRRSARTMSERTEHLEAVLLSAVRPSQEQEKRFLAFLAEKYGEGTTITWQKSDDYPDGFRLEVGAEVYDWSAGGRLSQFKDALEKLAATQGDVIPLLKETVLSWTPQAMAQEVGTVLTVGDGIARVDGLEGAAYGEVLLFDGGVRGMVQDLSEDSVGCILFDDDASVCAGSTVRRTGRTAGVPVGEGFLGRVVNALGVPIDGGGDIRADGYRAVESPAPGIIDRQSVDTPLETGILTVDSMFPIGRGQRELIIGDRQTGKTAIALDTIVNQKGKDVICIYVAIGQKASSVAQLKKTLETHGAMDYTIIVNATASDPAPLQYIAPYAGCAMGEYFMNKGRDVLIVYDDLSKHAIAYRAMSLLLERSPGREAYPGDVFYLHSRLLERAAHLSGEKGGGSITALPIIETQSGDVSAYIPTNVISITDGQLILETRLFFSGQRPAVNVGLSVSRVGGDAQTKAMKKAAKTIRLDLSQYREMESFTQFASDLDESTAKLLSYGQGLMRMLRQKQFHPYKQYEQVILLVAGLNHVFQEIVPEQLDAFIPALLQHFGETQGALCNAIEQTGQLSDDQQSQIIECAKEFVQSYFSK